MWHKTAHTTFHEGPGAPVDLRSIAGSAARLLFAERSRTHHMTHLPCTVAQVTAEEVVLDMTAPAQMPKSGSAVILEVAHDTALLQCFTMVRSVGPQNRLTLHTPDRPHVLQRRRFPRVDLFLGVTVSPPDSPLEQRPAQLTNLSMDGTACVVVEPISPGSEININLSAIGLHPPTAAAVVVRCIPTPGLLWLLGLKFLELDPTQEIYLEKYIADVVRLQSMR